MKVTLIGASVSQKGGIASVLRLLREQLQSEGIEVLLVLTSGASNSIGALLLYLRAIFTVIRNCLWNRSDVVHLHMASRGSCLRKTLIAAICLALRKPYIFHLHGGGFRQFFGADLGKAGRRWVTFIFRRAPFMIALSGAWKEWIDSTIAGTRTEVVFNGVPINNLSRSPANAIPTILFLGRVEAQKGIDDLISAFRRVASIVPDALLEIGGEGAIPFYEEKCRDLPTVRFLGWMDENQREAALRRAAVLTLPSWNEGLPMSILEAMSAGLPTVAIEVGGVPEVVVNGETGILVAPRDVDALASALAKILSNPELGKQMGNNGRTRQRMLFSTESMGRKCVSLYQQCGNKQPGSL
ncbi:LPS glycosyltransferase [Candidatus Burkholderia humilis]|nr:LPS glycosyltransferase [Candidatus Burkholderia humilis]